MYQFTENNNCYGKSIPVYLIKYVKLTLHRPISELTWANRFNWAITSLWVNLSQNIQKFFQKKYIKNILL